MKILTITLETAKEWYKNGDQTIKALLLENFTKEELEEKELPNSWEELGYIKGYFVNNYSKPHYEERQGTLKENKNLWPTKEYAEASLALSQLLQLRDRYQPYKPFHNLKYVICNFNGRLEKMTYWDAKNYIFNFETEKLRDMFYDNFENLLTQALPLL